MTGLLVFGLLSASALLFGGAGRIAPLQDSGPRSEPQEEGSIGDPALMLDLVAAMLEAGQPLVSALGILREGVDPGTARGLERLLRALELGMPWDAAWQLSAGAGTGRVPLQSRRQRLRQHPHTTEPPASGTPADLPASDVTGVVVPSSAAFRALGPALRFTALTGAPSAAVLHSQADALRRRRQTEGRRRAAALGVRLVVPLGLCSLPAFVALTVVPLLMSLLPGRL